MALKRENVVGRNKPTAPTPTPSPTPGKTSSKAYGQPVSDTLTARLDALLGASNIPLSTYVGQNASVGLISELSQAELKTMGTYLKKLGFSVRSLEDTRAILLTSDFPDADRQPNFNALLSYVRSQALPKTSGAGAGGGLPTQTIQKYSDDQLREIGNAVAQDFLGRNLEKAEVEQILPKLKKIIDAGTTTTSKIVGGKNVVTVTPGFSTTRAQAVIQSELGRLAPEDLQVKQYQDNVDWLSKNMAGM